MVFTSLILDKFPQYSDFVELVSQVTGCLREASLNFLAMVIQLVQHLFLLSLFLEVLFHIDVTFWVEIRSENLLVIQKIIFI